MDKNQKPDAPEEEYNGILGDFKEEEASETIETPASASASESEEKPKKNNNALKTVGIAVASAAILGCLGFLGVKLWNNPKQSQPETSQGEVSRTAEETGTATENPADKLPPNDTAAVYSENFEFSEGLMSCFYHDILSQMSSAMSYYGIDPATADLKTEKLPEEAGEDMTWFDYIMGQVKNTAEQLLIIQESANKAGYSMTEEDKQSLDEKVSAADMSSYGDNATEEDVRRMFEIQVLANSYVNHVLNEMQFSDEELETYYQENKHSFDTCGLMGYNIYYQKEGETVPEPETNEEGETETQAETDMPQQDAKKLADELMAVKEHDAFEEKVKDIFLNYEHRSEDMLSTMLSQIQSDSFMYQEDFELADWAFSEDTKVGDTYMIENDGYYSIYLLTREPSRDESTTVNVRHILFSPSSDSDSSEEDATAETATAGKTIEDCRKTAEDVLKEWESGDKSEESFGKLAEEYTEDPGSKSTGGLYEGVSEGQMVQEFNDWCFDASRKTGDTGIVETTYGVHVMYFSGKDTAWKSSARSQMKSENIDKWFEEQQALYPVAMNESIINQIS